MSFASDFYSFLIGDAEIAAAVGNDAGAVAKVYHQQVAQGEGAPYLVYFRVTGQTEYHYGGECELTRATIQVDCVGDSNTDDAETIAEAVRNRCGGYSGTMGSTVVESMFVQPRREQIDDTGDGSETFLARVILEIEVAYRQTAPTG